MTLMSFCLLFVGAAIIAALGVYAGKLVFLLRQQQQKGQQARDAYLANTRESIAVIAKAVSQGQCDLSEGSIRLTVLLERLGEQDVSKQYPSIHSLYQKIKHMPTHQARKALSKQQRFNMDKQRIQFEQQLEQGILAEVKVLERYQENS